MAIQGSGCGFGGHSPHVSTKLRSQRDQVMLHHRLHDGLQHWNTLDVPLGLQAWHPPRRTLTKLRAKHAETATSTFGIDGLTGQIADMKELGVWEPYEVKVQTMKTAIEAAAMLMRIDDIVSGIQKKNKQMSQPQQPQIEDGENARLQA